MNNGALGRRFIEEAAVPEHEARDALAAGRWHWAVRRAQEAVELALKGVLRLLGAEAPKQHDFADCLRRVLAARGHPAAEIEDLATLVRRLAGERGPAFYGDEQAGSPPAVLFDRAAAEAAIADMGRALAFARRVVAD